MSARRYAGCVALALLLVGARAVAAEPSVAAQPALTVGLFAPAAPFPSTSARVAFAAQLARAVGDALDAPAVGRVYARAADFAAAVRRGEVALAVVDPAYLATAGGSYAVLGVALGGDARTYRAWRIVARAGTRLVGLRDRRVAVPSVGGRENDFVFHLLLDGDVPRDYFAAIEAAPDSASALAAVALGKVDAAIVPATGELPAGTVEVLALPRLASSMLVAYAALPAASRRAALGAAAALAGDATITGFEQADDEVVRRVARRFAPPPTKQAPFAVPANRPAFGELLGDRRIAIPRAPLARFLAPVP